MQVEYLNEIKILKNELDEAKKSQKFMNDQYKTLKSEYDEYKKQEKEICNLKTNSSKLEIQTEKDKEKVYALEQYGRRQNLELAGILFRDGEDTNKMVMDVAKLIDVEISANQISTSHRLQAKKNDKSKNPAPPPIIVRCLSRDVKNKIYSN